MTMNSFRPLLLAIFLSNLLVILLLGCSGGFATRATDTTGEDSTTSRRDDEGSTPQVVQQAVLPNDFIDVQRAWEELPSNKVISQGLNTTSAWPTFMIPTTVRVRSYRP